MSGEWQLTNGSREAVITYTLQRNQVPHATDLLIRYAASGANLTARRVTVLQSKDQQQALLQAGWEAGLELNTEKTKYMFMSRHQNAG
jgi:hypothetical protein